MPGLVLAHKEMRIRIQDVQADHYRRTTAPLVGYMYQRIRLDAALYSKEGR